MAVAPQAHASLTPMWDASMGPAVCAGRHEPNQPSGPCLSTQGSAAIELDANLAPD